jgi:ketosteroid isomerase-like protein
MPQENVEVVRKQFENANARDFAGVVDAWAENVTLIVRGELWPFTGDTATGKAAVRQWFADWFREFGPDYRFDIDETHASGDRVFVFATHHGRGRHSDAPVELGSAYIYTLREGKVSRIEVWASHDAREAALEAAGLRE